MATPTPPVPWGAWRLRASSDLPAEAKAGEAAGNAVLDEGYRTADIMSEGKTQVKGSEMTRLIVERI